MTNIQFQSGAIDAGACVSNAWEQVKQNYGLYLGMTVVAIILTGCIPCLNIFLIGPILGGVFYIALRDMRQEPVDFGMMFKGFEKFVPLMVVGLIQAIPGIIGQFLQFGLRLGELGLGGIGSTHGDYDFFQASDPDLAIAGGLVFVVVIVAFVFMIFTLVWWAVFFFAIPLAMEHDLGPIDAIKLSAQAAMNNIGGLILLLIFQVLIGLLGVLMCFIGVFLISVPIMYVANAIAYRQVFPANLQNNFNMAPPPPSAYGNFGTGM
ncbi:MAG: hypothetical protein IPL32_06450 [Chloracidobacterium sp.]|nr:hypothetical protein [Chloracidobacterium sp.]